MLNGLWLMMNDFLCRWISWYFHFPVREPRILKCVCSTVRFEMFSPISVSNLIQNKRLNPNQPFPVTGSTKWQISQVTRRPWILINWHPELRLCYTLNKVHINAHLTPSWERSHFAVPIMVTKATDQYFLVEDMTRTCQSQSTTDKTRDLRPNKLDHS